jgi:hypothetical protein
MTLMFEALMFWVICSCLVMRYLRVLSLFFVQLGVGLHPGSSGDTECHCRLGLRAFALV